jgi:hypothetical protein
VPSITVRVHDTGTTCSFLYIDKRIFQDTEIDARGERAAPGVSFVKWAYFWFGVSIVLLWTDYLRGDACSIWDGRHPFERRSNYGMPTTARTHPHEMPLVLPV